jgi:hypothetical protein
VHRYRLVVRRYWPQLTVGLVVLVIFAAIAFWAIHKHRTVIDSFDSCAAAGYPISTTDPQTCSANHHTYVEAESSPATSTSTGPTGTSQTYTVLVSGDSRGTYPQKQQVITTQAAWTAFWAQVNAKVSPFPPILPVDFSQDEVIALTEGPKPSGGYALELTGVLAGTSSASVAYDEIVPGEACTTATGPTDYYLLASTPKTTGPVSFTSTKVRRKC